MKIKVSNNGFTLLELLIVLAVLGLLAAIAIPAYQNFRQRMYYSKIVEATAPFKKGVTACYETSHSFKECHGGAHHIPANITTVTGPVASITVKEGVITTTPISAQGITMDDIYILTPSIVKDEVTWTTSGSAVKKALAS